MGVNELDCKEIYLAHRVQEAALEIELTRISILLQKFSDEFNSPGMYGEPV